MRIRTLVLAVLAIITVFGSWFLYRWVIDSIRPSYLQVVEENLVETSRILAANLSTDPRPMDTILEHLRKSSTMFRETPFEATIYDVTKTHPDLEFYLTDSTGVVLFHSHDPNQVGKDFSAWNDVHLTLSGGYGVRSTRTDPENAATSRLHVAAPVYRQDALAGVLTVIKPITWPYAFMERARQHLLVGTAIVLGVSILLAFGLSSWITIPIERLTRHADALADGSRAPEPRPGLSREIRKLHGALRRMRAALDGKAYIEHYVKTLTHEIKSPLSGIRGAAELLDEDMDVLKRRQFLENIRRETKRIDRIVEQLLRLAELEATDAIPNPVPVDLNGLLQGIMDEHRPNANARKIEFRFSTSRDSAIPITGDVGLIRLAVGAILQNAIEFSPDRSLIEIEFQSSAESSRISIRDHGPGIPDFARGQIMDRFFSLPRPNGAHKSSGLGLSLASEIAKLHNASLTVRPHPEGGTIAALEFFGSRSASGPINP